ncbi:helix-turn-helix transcriptional regulator [Enterococcus faecalis]|uniref:helix-turn-helix transcriptional regulator n=1 Tax=Enterococcus TaxID=1350 RepID=UPI0018A2B456|nr:DNA-binding protein [Enterococcus faecalis]
MHTLEVPITLPSSFSEEVAEVITKIVMEKVEKRLLVNELPPYPTKKEVMQILNVGFDRIDEWMADGLTPVRAFGIKVQRFDRDDIREYINSTKN